jgi:hypothetical protein
MSHWFVDMPQCLLYSITTSLPFDRLEKSKPTGKPPRKIWEVGADEQGECNHLGKGKLIGKKTKPSMKIGHGASILTPENINHYRCMNN